MDQNQYQLEDYKQIWNAIIDVDKRILQVFGSTIVIAVSLLSAVAGLVLGKGAGDGMSIVFAYLGLAPSLILIPSFNLMLSQRIDIMRLGAYRRVFYEEQYAREGWEVHLYKFRNLEQKESNDPIPWSFWAIFAASAALFSYGLIKTCASLWHLSFLVIPTIFLGTTHYKWSRVISKILPKYVELWRKVQGDRKTA